MVAIFLLRIDDVTGKGEGEVYYAKSKGVIDCNVWNSKNLSNHQVIIANGQDAINKTFDKYLKTHHIVTGVSKCKTQ